MENKGSINDRRNQIGRVHFVANFHLMVDGKRYDHDHTENLSMSGVLIIGDDILPIDTEGEFFFSLHCGEAEGVQIKGKFKVVNHREMDGKKGMGLSFTEVDPECSMELYRVVRYNSPE